MMTTEEVAIWVMISIIGTIFFVAFYERFWK